MSLKENYAVFWMNAIKGEIIWLGDISEGVKWEHTEKVIEPLGEPEYMNAGWWVSA